MDGINPHNETNFWLAYLRFTINQNENLNYLTVCDIADIVRRKQYRICTILLASRKLHAGDWQQYVLLVNVLVSFFFGVPNIVLWVGVRV